METASNFVLCSIKEHAKKKGMWLGIKNLTIIPNLLGAINNQSNMKIIDINRPHTPALLKIFDEIIVNATDHAKGQEHDTAAKRVKNITIDFDLKSGVISVFNDGAGIPVIKHDAATKQEGRDIYIPELAFAIFLAGTNIDKGETNIKGGTNGLGAKLANLHSTSFHVETVDSKLHYSQQFLNELDVIELPIITPRKAGTSQFTKVTFRPIYEKFGYKIINNALTAEDAADLNAWLCLRAHQVAAYVGANVCVKYNSTVCETTDISSLSKLVLTQIDESDQAIIMHTQVKSSNAVHKQFPWDVAIIMLPQSVRKYSMQNMTIINGVISTKGTHIQYIRKILGGAVEEKMKTLTKSKKDDDKKWGLVDLLSNIRLVMCGSIPGVDWTGQNKEEVQIPKDIIEKYSITKTFLSQVGVTITERLLLNVNSKSKKIKHDVRSYHGARYAGTANRKNTFLFAAEGKSAISFVDAGLTLSKNVPPGGPSLDWCGYISLQGVIINAARETTELETSGGEVINVRSLKLQNNQRLLELAEEFGLNYDYTYTTQEELDTLRYNQLVLCVDQDLDGTGKIAPLVLVWIYTYWPALFKAGKIGKFVTPLIRVYNKKGKINKPVAEFYYNEELTEWMKTNSPEKYFIKYYKGLATHDTDEVPLMFNVDVFKKNIFTYELDDHSKELFNIYFGSDPKLRKTALVTPVKYLDGENILILRQTQKIPIGKVQLEIDTKAYKNDAIKRQIAGGPDGLNPARRKILMGASLRFTGEESSKELKIFQLGGYVADKCFYHHGDASLSSTIIYLAQSFPGARLYPYLIGIGQFGNRHGGEAGSARYISVKLSPLMKAVFPPEDRWLLEYEFEDGERAEPKYYVPVVPMATLESYRIVSEGWNHDSYGRDLGDTLKIVYAYIDGDPELNDAADELHKFGMTESVIKKIEMLATKWPMRPNTREFDGEIRAYRGDSEYSFGMYHWDESTRTITISDLPIGVVTSNYIKSLKEEGKSGVAQQRHAYIHRITDYSSPTKIDIKIVLKPGAFEEIIAKYGNVEIDPIEDIFMLRSSMRPHLNYYGTDGSVLEFGEQYIATILYWAPLRKELYRKRLMREKILLELKIKEESEIVRYITLSDKKINTVSDETFNEYLKANDFVRINSGLLHNPEYTPYDELYSLVINHVEKSSYEYILNLREREFVMNAVEARKRKIEKYQLSLQKVCEQLDGRPLYSELWKSEINKFMDVVAEGIKTNWKFK